MITKLDLNIYIESVFNKLHKTIYIEYGDDSEQEKDLCEDSISNKGITNVMSSTELKHLLEGKECELSKQIFGTTTSNDLQDPKQESKHIRNHLFVIQFAAEWCGLCSSIEPTMNVSYHKIEDLIE